MDDTYRGGSAPTIEDSQSQVFDDRQVQSAGLKITQQHNGHHLLPQGVTLPATIPEYENHFPGATHEPCISTAPAALGGYTRSLHLDVDSEDYSTTPQSFELGMDEYQAQQVFIRMQRRPRSQPADKTPTGGGFSSHRQLLDLAGLRDVIRQVILEVRTAMYSSCFRDIAVA